MSPLDILEAETALIKNWGENVKLLITEESLPDLQWQKLQQCDEKPYTTVQPAEVGLRPSSFKLLPRKDPYVQDAGKPSE